MLERTADEIAQIFTAAGHSVNFINTAEAPSGNDDEYKKRVQRNVEHLEVIKGYTKADGSSIWTTEDFTDIDKAIIDGKKKYE